MIIEQPIEISSPLPPQKRDYLSSPTSPPKPAPKLREITETTAFVLDHPYAHPYTVRDATSMPMPPSTIGTASNAGTHPPGPVSVRSMPHPYSSRSRQDQHHPNLDRFQQVNTTNGQTHTTAPTTITDESQQYESFMTPDTPRSLSFKELSLSLTSPDTIESGLNPAATRETAVPSSSTERDDRTGIAPALTTTAATTSTSKVTYPPSAYTHDTIHSEDTLPSMYSYTSTSGPIPIQELHFTQASPPQSRNQIR
ncbi:hypothetical protein Clacol_000582 [Clathrus columnatus]|uniref:Uncharacterized protein n=1 Tax=Clathrus columnatus TaxID=1419009 RepID=A0AAV4ZWR6_9AGAM|nr:hypothetical protein Clacol_000582 [Clathrus columnatus]